MSWNYNTTSSICQSPPNVEQVLKKADWIFGEQVVYTGSIELENKTQE